MASSTSNAVVGFLTGFTMGGIAGMVYALEREESLRYSSGRRTWEGHTDPEENIGESINDLKKSVTEFLDDINRRLETIESGV